MSCTICACRSSLSVMAVRIVDGDLLAGADYCRQHALELAQGFDAPHVKIEQEHLGDHLDQCYRTKCECLPFKLFRCDRCTRLADVWLVAGTEDDLRDLDGGIKLCGSCTQEMVSGAVLPTELREALRRRVLETQ